MKLLPALIAVCLTACISSAPIVPVTPANSAQVSSCQSIASAHNGFVVGDMVIGGVATTFASTSAAIPATNGSARAVTAIAAAVLAGFTGTGVGLAGFYASNFADSKCSEVVGSLPEATALADAGLPVEPTVVVVVPASGDAGVE